jgi:hypothetical protein
LRACAPLVARRCGTRPTLRPGPVVDPPPYFSASQLAWIEVATSIGVRAAGKVDHAGPEGARTDRARHQVGAVEAEGGGVQQDLALAALGVVE